jgi:hypothetical protein
VSDVRPEWEYSISESDFAWLLQSIVKITHHWAQTGNDTAEDWIELHTHNDKKRFNTGFLNGNDLFCYKPNWRELVQPTWNGDQAKKRYEEIQVWEKKNQRDRSEFERLKKKFNNND